MTDTATPAIRLGERESAEPKTCGSCKHYYRPRDGDGGRGNCNFKMPPWIKLLHTHRQDVSNTHQESFENSSDPTMVYDNQTCSLWEPSGQTYVQDRVWTVHN